MKKILFLFLFLGLLTNINFAKDCINVEEKQPQAQENCEKCPIEDDEYCVYNQCYFNSRYRHLKEILCLTSKQEAKMDTLYKNYKEDLENYCQKYRTQKNKILEQIACGETYNVCVLDEIEKDMKERCKCFRQDIKDILCKNQYKDFKKQMTKERKTMKQLIKYSKVYKFPCIKCDCNNNCKE